MELTTSTCSFCSPLQWSFFSSLCPETTLSVGSFSNHHQCHLIVLVFFISKVQSVQPTMPAFPLLTPIICMVLVFLLTTKLSCSASSGGAVPLLPDFWLIDSASLHTFLAQPYSFFFSLLHFPGGLSQPQVINTIHMVIIPVVIALPLTSPLNLGI